MTADQETREITAQDANDWSAWIENSQKGLTFAVPKYDATVNISRRIDLHGMTVNHAYNAVREFIFQQLQNGTRDVVVVTGKSGQIRDEFVGWLANIKDVSRYEPLLDKRGGVGSYRLYLRTTRPTTAK